MALLKPESIHMHLDHPVTERGQDVVPHYGMVGVELQSNAAGVTAENGEINPLRPFPGFPEAEENLHERQRPVRSPRYNRATRVGVFLSPLP